MNETTIMDVIPPEQWTMIIAAIIGLLGTILAALGFLFRWFVRYFARSQDEKLNAMRQEREKEKLEFEAKLEFQRMEWQSRLDATETGRETQRLWMSQLDEERKDNAKQREASERREAIYTQAIQGIESNTAAVFNLMKEMVEKLGNHQEADEVMAIRQERLIAQGNKTHSQNETTHAKIESLASTLSEIALELKGLTGSRQNDRRVIDDILQKVLAMQDSLAQIESKAVVNATPDVTPVAPTETTEIDKELNKKEEPQ